MGLSNNKTEHLKSFMTQFSKRIEEKDYLSAAMQVRYFVETIIKDYYSRSNSTLNEDSSSFEKLTYLEENTISKDFANALHELRKLGNAGAHADFNSPEITLLRNPSISERYVALMAKSIDYYMHDSINILSHSKKLFEDYLLETIHVSTADYVYSLKQLSDSEDKIEFSIDSLIFSYLTNLPFSGSLILDNKAVPPQLSYVKINCQLNNQTVLLYDGSTSGLLIDNTTPKQKMFSFISSHEKGSNWSTLYSYKKYAEIDSSKYQKILFADLLSLIPNYIFECSNCLWRIGENGIITLALNGKNHFTDTSEDSYAYNRFTLPLIDSLNKWVFISARIFANLLGRYYEIPATSFIFSKTMTDTKIEYTIKNNTYQMQQKNNLGDCNLIYTYYFSGKQSISVNSNGKSEIYQIDPHKCPIVQAMPSDGFIGCSLFIDYQALTRQLLRFGANIPSDSLSGIPSLYNDLHRMALASTAHTIESIIEESALSKEQCNNLHSDEKEQRKCFTHHPNTAKKKKYRRRIILAITLMALFPTLLGIYSSIYYQSFISDYEDIPAPLKKIFIDKSNELMSELDFTEGLNDFGREHYVSSDYSLVGWLLSTSGVNKNTLSFVYKVTIITDCDGYGGSFYTSIDINNIWINPINSTHWKGTYSICSHSLASDNSNALAFCITSLYDTPPYGHMTIKKAKSNDSGYKLAKSHSLYGVDAQSKGITNENQ